MSARITVPSTGAVVPFTYLEVGSVLLDVLLHTLAELQDPAPLGLHGRSVGLKEKTQPP